MAQAQRNPEWLSFWPPYFFTCVHPHIHMFITHTNPHRSFKTKGAYSYSSSSCYLCVRNDDILKKHCSCLCLSDCSIRQTFPRSINLGEGAWGQPEEEYAVSWKEMSHSSDTLADHLQGRLHLRQEQTGLLELGFVVTHASRSLLNPDSCQEQGRPWSRGVTGPLCLSSDIEVHIEHISLCFSLQPSP